MSYHHILTFLLSPRPSGRGSFLYGAGGAAEPPFRGDPAVDPTPFVDPEGEVPDEPFPVVG
jgi:hypothetical protein